MQQHPDRQSRPRRTVFQLYVLLLLALFIAGAPWGSPAYAKEDASSPLVFGQGLLWKIERDGVEPSYIFGTIHAGDERVVQLPPPVRQAFDGAATFVMEVVPGEELSAKMRRAMFYHEGQTLESVVGEELYRRSLDALAKYGITEQVAVSLKPWAIVSTLSVPETRTAPALDQRLYQQAVKQGKRVKGLESPQEQIAALDEMTRKDQVELLEGTLETFDQRFEVYDKLIAAYLERDITAIFALNEQYTEGNQRLADVIDQRIFLERNKRMVKRIAPLLQQGDMFIAIGAGHLPGKTGVLSQLQGRGYGVSLVY